MFDHIKNDHLRIEYRTNALRISGIIPRGGKNLLVDLSDLPPIETQYGDFKFLGGHRLWYAPEKMPDTYVPDIRGLKIVRSEHSVWLETPHEPITNIRKQIEITLEQDSPEATITHALINDGGTTQRIAPWAITQFKPGGTAIMPLSRDPNQCSDLLPDRQITYWPYTEANDPRLKITNNYLFFHGAHIDQAFKVGTFCAKGWLAYQLNGVVFKKSFPDQPSISLPDLGCNAEIYGCGKFVELESLAPFVELEPGMSVTHTEKWEILANLGHLDPDLE